MMIENAGTSAPVNAGVMPVVDSCPMCGIPFRDHLGLIGTCRKYHGTRTALIELLRASETAIRVLTNEFGDSAVKANFEPLLDAIDLAKRSE